MYVYRKLGSKKSVGFFDLHGTWIEESSVDDVEVAAARVSYLNGGLPSTLIDLMEAWLGGELDERDRTKYDI